MTVKFNRKLVRVMACIMAPGFADETRGSQLCQQQE